MKSWTIFTISKVNIMVSHSYNLCNRFQKFWDEIWRNLFWGFSSIFLWLHILIPESFFDDWRFIRTFNSFYRFSIGFKSGLSESHRRISFFGNSDSDMFGIIILLKSKSPTLFNYYYFFFFLHNSPVKFVVFNQLF